MTDRPYSPYLSDQERTESVADRTARFLEEQRAYTAQQNAMQDAVNQAIQSGLVPAVGEDGKPITFREALQLSLRRTAADPNNTFGFNAEKALRNNPLVAIAYSDEDSFNALKDDVTKRALNIQNNRTVNNPYVYGDKPLTEQVEGWNREDPGFWKRLYRGTLEALGFNGRGDLEDQIARMDERLSAYPKEFRNAFKKMEALHREDMILDSLKEQAKNAKTREEYENIHQKIELQTGKIHELQEKLTDTDKQLLMNYGKSYLQDQRTRNDLKAVEHEITPRYQTTYKKELELARLNQEYLNKGESASFTDPASFYNGYAAKWMGVHLLDWDTLTKEVGAEVLPWVAINFTTDAVAAALTKGLSLPASVSKWAIRFGIQGAMAGNSAYQALDKNLDAYYQKYGTTEGFSKAQSNFLEAVAFGFDMYGSRLIAGGLPKSAAAFIDTLKTQKLDAIRNIFRASREAYAATGSLATINAGFKTAYNIANGTALTEALGKFLENQGKKSVLTYGGLSGKATQLAGQAIQKGTDVARNMVVNPALGLATENMMSEATRQQARQTGFNAEGIAEAGMKGIVAGPVGRVGGLAAGTATHLANKAARAFGDTYKYAYTANEMHDFTESVNGVIKDGSNQTKANTYEKLTEAINSLEKKATEDVKLNKIKESTQQLLKKYVGKIELGETDKETTELPDPDAVERLTLAQDTSKETKAVLKQYRKDYKNAVKEQEIIKNSGNLITEQLDTLKKLRDELGESIQTDSAIYQMGEASQTEYLKNKGYSKEETANIIEDSKGKLKIDGLSDRALNRVRNIFGSDAPGRLKEVLNNTTDAQKKAILDELNKSNADFSTIQKAVTPATLPANATKEQRDEFNKANYASKTLKNMFDKSQEKQQAYRDSIKDKEIDPSKLTVDEAEAIAPGALTGLNEAEVNSVLSTVQNTPALHEISEGKGDSAQAVVNAAMAKITQSTQLPSNVERATKQIAEALLKHQKEVGTKENGKGRTPKTTGTQGERVAEGIYDKDTQATMDIKVATGKESDVEGVRDYLSKEHSLSEIQEYIKSATNGKVKVEDKVLEFLKNRADFKKLIKQKNPTASKQELQDMLNNFTSIDTITELGLSESQAIAIISKSVNFQHILEANKNREASEKAAKSAGKHIDRVKRKSGYKTNTELRDEAVKRNEQKAIITQAQKYREEREEVYKKDDADFLYNGEWTKKDIFKFMIYVHNNVFGGLIDGLLNKSINDDNGLLQEEVYKWMIKADNNAFRKDGEKILVSDRWFNQLRHLIEACQYYSRQPDGTTFEYMGNNLAALYSLVQACVDNPHINVERDNNAKEPISLWSNSAKIFNTEILTTDKTKEDLYPKYSDNTLPNATSIIRTHLAAIQYSENLFERAYENMLDMHEINSAKSQDPKALLGFSTLVGGALQDKLINYLGASQVTLGEQLFGLINYFVHEKGSFLWDIINGWGYKDPKLSIPNDVSIREKLLEDSRNPVVRDFFTLDDSRTGATRTPEEWRNRWDTRSAHAQRAIAVALLNNRYVLGKLLKLKELSTEKDIGPRNFADVSTGQIFKKIESEAELKKIVDDLNVKTLNPNDKDKPDLFTKIAIANQLANHGLANIVDVQWYTLHTLLDTNSDESITKLFTKGIFKKDKTHWSNIIQFVQVFNKSKIFQEIVENAKKYPLGERGHLPSKDKIEKIIKELGDTDQVRQELQTLNSLKAQMFSNPEHFTDDVQAVFGNIVAAAGFVSLCKVNNQEALSVSDPSKVEDKDVTLSLSDNSNILIELDNVVSYMQEAATGYTNFQAIDEEHIGIEQLQGFISNIINSDPKVRGKVKDLAEKIRNSDSYDNNNDTFPLTSYLESISKGEFPQNTDLLSEGSKLAIAKIFAGFINQNHINNTVIANDSSIDVDYLNDKRHEDTLADKAHKYSVLSPSNGDHKLFIRAKNSVFLHQRGFDRFLAENPLLANNEYIRLVKDVTSKLANRVKQMPDDVIGETEFDLDGNIYNHTLQVCVAVGLAMMPRLSVNVNDDFIDALRGKYGPAIADTFAQQSNNLIDLSTTAKAMGTQIARILGYNKHSPMFNLIATRLGGIACLALTAGETGVEAVWVDQSGNIKGADSSGAEKANAIPALQLNDKAQANKQRLEIALKSKGISGESRDLSEIMLGTEMFSNERVYTTMDQQLNLDTFIDEWIDYHSDISNTRQTIENLRNIAWKEADTTAVDGLIPATTELKTVTGDGRAINWTEFEKQVGKENIKEIKGEAGISGRVGSLVRVGDVALVMYQLDENKQLKAWNTESDKKVYYTIMKNRAVTKTDLTEVAPFRLLLTALNQRKGVTVKGEDALNFFAPLLESDGNGGYKLKDIFKNIDDLTPEQIDEKCYQTVQINGEDTKVLSDLGILIYENSKYGSNPNETSGVPKLNIQISNKEDLKRMVKDCEVLLQHKAIGSGTQTFYFNELNTVNNRLFVDSLRFNYREFKHYRSITSVQSIDVSTANLTADQQALLVAPIMFNLGLDIDKMRDMDKIRAAWSNLLKDSAFQELIETVRSLTGSSNTQKLRNQDVKHLDLNNQIIAAIAKYNAKTQATYSAFKSVDGKESDEVKATFKINVESVSALTKLANIKLGDGNGTTFLDCIRQSNNGINSNATFFNKIIKAGKISGYNILIEVDGLTNGPSIKNIISNLPTNKDVFSALYMGATGISRDFNNIVAGYADYGILDTYLYNGKLAKEDLVYQACMEMQNNNDKHFYRSNAYISSLYGQTYEKNNFKLPSSFVDTFVAALNKALSRNFMKRPVMVIGYEAGKASVIATNMAELDKQFSKMLAKGDNKVLREWCDNLHSTYGDSVSTVTLEYVEGGRVLKAKLNVADRTIECEAFRGGSVSIDALTTKQVQSLSINHMANVALSDVIADTFGSMYDSISHNKQIVQTPFRTLTDSSQVLCEVFDTLLRKALEHHITDSDESGSYITSSKFVPAITNIVNELTNKFNTIARGGVESEEENKALVQLSKQDVESLVGEAIAQYTTTKDGKYYLRVKTGYAARVSLGAGVVPMIVHTYDSSIAHMMMGKVLNKVNQRILTIHDAGLLGLFQETDETGGIRELNKAHYECMLAFPETLVDYTSNLYRAINSVDALAKNEIFKLSSDEIMQLKGKLSTMADRMFSETAQLLTLKERFFNEELDKGENERVKDFQYSFAAKNKSDEKALGIYIPDNDALKDYIKRTNETKKKLLNLVDLNSYKSELTEAFKTFAERTIETSKLKAVLDTNNQFQTKIWRHATSTEELAKVIADSVNGLNEQGLLAEFNRVIDEANKQTPEYKLKQAMLDSYKDTIKDRQSGTDYAPIVNVKESINSVSAAKDEVGLVRSIYQLSENSRKNGFFHINDEAALQRTRIESLLKLRGFNKDNGLLGIFSTLRSMTGLNTLSDMDNTSFNTLFNVLSQMVSSDDSPATLHIDEKIDDRNDVEKYAFFTDSNDYSQILRNAKREQVLKGTQQDFDKSYLIQWFSTVLKDFQQFEDKKVQLIFTLRSEGDLLHLLALQALKNNETTHSRYANVSVYIAPAISNLTSEAPAVNKEVAILQVLKHQIKDLKAHYVTSTHYTHNVALQSYIMGRELNKATTERGLRLSKETILGLQEIAVNSKKGKPGTYYKYYSNMELDTSTFGNGDSEIAVVNRKDELGRSIEGPQSPVNGLTSVVPRPTDLLTVPRDTELTYNYDEAILENGYRYEQGDINNQLAIAPLNIAEQGNTDATQRFEKVLGEGSDVASIIETSVEGHIASPTLRDYSQHDPMFKEALFKADVIRQQRKAEYQTSERRERDWNKYLMPIVVSVPNEGFTNKYFIFVTAFDNSITQKDLMNSIQDRGTGEVTVAQMARIREGSNLAGMLKESAKTNYRFMKRMARMKDEEAAIKEDSHVVIPEDFITTSLKVDTSKLAEKNNLMYRNAYCLNSINTMLRERGVTSYTLPVQSVDAYRYLTEDGGLPGPRFTRNMHNQVHMFTMEMATNVFDELVNAMQQRRQREKMAYASLQASVIRRYRGHAPNTHQPLQYGNETTARFLTRNDYLTSSNPLGYTLTFDKAEQQFNELLDHMLEDDESRNVDTSLVRENRELLNGLITLAGVNFFADPSGVEASYTGVSSRDNPLERNEVFLGRALGTQSGSEAFLHEMFHTILVHLGRNNPSVKKKLTDLYNFTVKNLTYDDFTDGQTFTNESIMDAITNEETPDNVEEFMCYYLTNKAFHTAVENMANRKGANIKEILKANSTGIFRRILNAVRNWILGKKAEYQEVQTVRELVTQAVTASMAYNNQYWQNRKGLIEKATKRDIQELADIESQRNVAGKIIYGQQLSEKAVETAVNDTKFDKAVRGAIQAATQELEVATNFVGLDLKKAWRDAQDGFLNDLMGSLEGASKRQFDYLILRTRGKAQIDQKREQIKSVINEHVREILKDVPEKYYERLTAKFIRTDVSCLFRNTNKDIKQIKELITNPSARQTEIKRLEGIFRNYDYRNYVINSAKGLAHYLVTGFNPTGIGYRNAHEILARAGSSTQTVTVNGPEFNALDQLITLYALEDSKPENLKFFEEIPEDTLNKLAAVHNSVKDADNDKVYPNTFSASNHVPKGELHTTNNMHRYEIIPESEYRAYKWTGYRKVSDAVLDPFFAAQYPNTKFIMVRAPFKSEAATTAGIFSMTNIFKGRSSKGISIGNAFRTNKDEIPFKNTQEYARIKAYMDRRIDDLNSSNPHLLTTPTSGNMVLNFNSMNTLCGATFEVNPIESIKQRSTSQKVTSILGNLYGSILERTESPLMNTKIGEAMADIYDNAKDPENFRWIKPTSENAQYRELYETIPFEIRDVMTKRYGDRGIPVHAKSLNTVFGYRNLSANDTKKFIEQERAKQANADKLASNFSVNMGNILYNGYLGNIESFFRWLAKTGKENIVIKGVTTSWYNIISNCILLHMKGLSAKQMINYQLEGLKQYDTVRQLSYQLAVLKRKRIMNQYSDVDAKQESAIRKTIESLDIYPLYREGITGNTIAEDLTESDGFIKAAIHALVPQGKARVIVNNLALSNESMLYKILADFASLGDITGKYALYRFNKEKFTDEKEALRQSLETFIDYSNPLPKQLQLMDDLAILPFMKYALGIQRVIGELMSEKPSRSLSWLLGANTLVSIPNTFQSLLDVSSITDRMQLPGEMFTDSFHTLPSWKALSNSVPDV